MFLLHEGDLRDDNLMGRGERLSTITRRTPIVTVHVRFSRMRFVIGGEEGEVVNRRLKIFLQQIEDIELFVIIVINCEQFLSRLLS